MPLLNYSTSVPVDRTIMEITRDLVKAGATQVGSQYDGHGRVTGLSFSITLGGQTYAYTLPVRAEAVHAVLTRQRVEGRYSSRAHAEQVAWRITRDWVRSQLAIIQTEMVTLDQVMLPYMHTNDGATVYDNFKAGRSLPAGQGGR